MNERERKAKKCEKCEREAGREKREREKRETRPVAAAWRVNVSVLGVDASSCEMENGAEREGSKLLSLILAMNPPYHRIPHRPCTHKQITPIVSWYDIHTCVTMG